MKTKKALAGLLGLLGSFPAFFPAFLPAPALLLFSLITNFETNTNQNSTTIQLRDIYRSINKEKKKKKEDQTTISTKKKTHLGSVLRGAAFDLPPFMANLQRKRRESVRIVRKRSNSGWVSAESHRVTSIEEDDRVNEEDKREDIMLWCVRVCVDKKERVVSEGCKGKPSEKIKNTKAKAP